MCGLSLCSGKKSRENAVDNQQKLVIMQTQQEQLEMEVMKRLAFKQQQELEEEHRRNKQTSCDSSSPENQLSNSGKDDTNKPNILPEIPTQKEKDHPGGGDGAENLPQMCGEQRKEQHVSDSSRYSATNVQLEMSTAMVPKDPISAQEPKKSQLDLHTGGPPPENSHLSSGVYSRSQGPAVGPQSFSQPPSQIVGDRTPGIQMSHQDNIPPMSADTDRQFEAANMAIVAAEKPHLPKEDVTTVGLMRLNYKIMQKQQDCLSLLHRAILLSKHRSAQDPSSSKFEQVRLLAAGLLSTVVHRLSYSNLPRGEEKLGRILTGHTGHDLEWELREFLKTSASQDFLDEDEIFTAYTQELSEQKQLLQPYDKSLWTQVNSLVYQTDLDPFIQRILQEVIVIGFFSLSLNLLDFATTQSQFLLHKDNVVEKMNAIIEKMENYIGDPQIREHTAKHFLVLKPEEQKQILPKYEGFEGDFYKQRNIEDPFRLLDLLQWPSLDQQMRETDRWRMYHHHFEDPRMLQMVNNEQITGTQLIATQSVPWHT